MAAKSCVGNLVKPFLRIRHRSVTFGFKAFERSLHESVAKPLPVSCRGVSLHSLPGNRLFLSPAANFAHFSCRMKSLHISDNETSWSLGVSGIEELEDFTPLTDAELQQNVGEQINKSLEQGEAGRLFAVVYIRGIQHKVTAEDIIAVKYDFPPNVGDRIRLEKVLCVGGKDFTLFGQPLLSRDIVRIDATVVEKTLSHNRVWFVYRKRKNFKKLHVYREKFTMLLINSIQVAKVPVPEEKEAEEEKGSV